MAAAKNEGSCAVEAIGERGEAILREGSDRRKARQQQKEGADREQGGGLGDADAERRGRCLDVRSEKTKAEESSSRNDCQLKTGTRLRNQQRRSEERNPGALPVRAKVPAHAPNGLGDHRYGKQFQSMNEALRGVTFSIAQAIGSQNHEDRRRQGKPCPGGKPTRKPSVHQTQRESCLGTRRTRHELGQRHNVGIGLVAQPLAAVYELASKIPEMSDGSAETCAAQPQKRQEDRERVCHLRSQPLIRSNIMPAAICPDPRPPHPVLLPAS